MLKKFAPFLIIILPVICVYFFSLPAALNWMNLSHKQDLGNAINGMTAPVIGIIGAWLLYLALTAQLDANSRQKLKNEVDLILMLLNQFEHEFSGLYGRYQVKNAIEGTVNGQEALDDFSIRFQDYKVQGNGETFRTYKESGQICLLLSSLQIIKHRIESGDLTPENKAIFTKRLTDIFNYKFRVQLNNILKHINEFPYHKDELTGEMEKFYAKWVDESTAATPD